MGLNLHALEFNAQPYLISETSEDSTILIFVGKPVFSRSFENNYKDVIKNIKYI